MNEKHGETKLKGVRYIPEAVSRPQITLKMAPDSAEILSK